MIFLILLEHLNCRLCQIERCPFVVQRYFYDDGVVLEEIDSEDYRILEQYVLDGSTITAKPYGWASKENKVEGVNYELNAPDVVASVIFAPSVIAPVLLTAYDVWEPVSYTEPSK